MASVVSFVFSLPSVFTSCVDCFQYFHLEHTFGIDYENSLIQLDVAHLRLSRWGESIRIETDQPLIESEAERDHAKNLLQAIINTFDDARRVSSRYNNAAKMVEPCETPSFQRQPSFQTSPVHGKLRKMAHRRQKGTGFLRRVKWALHDKKTLDDLIEKVTKYTDQLVELFPAAPLAAMESDESSQTGEHESLQTAAVMADVDNGPEKPLVTEIEMPRGHEYHFTEVEDEAWMLNGDYVASGSVCEGRSHSYGEMRAHD
ncbi:hypothetical protein ASPZODRAFT_1258731 [Penicilliopsis zonata CBS 506.65]|uniref:Prion-inhibition and propagation HeLo domain-containing protein n=1 Tax=Penicilliopsis zonata CBS 506.65 TaxID=1073090 RepID=A0A1L9S6I5_9EURO|nr:hypothetical protein ASPZODRAFT_1258731 [Penicilliopsis zonata CBS 506.65]OJJ42792.1 hypothetical protein ASPZODRAFT_1258731 [Penicilliopsis zonata CBS 506.65]